MPTPSQAHLPRPKAADEFEDMVTDVLRLRHGKVSFVRFGRSGQSQRGIDGFDPLGEAIVWQSTLRSGQILQKLERDLSKFDREWTHYKPERFVYATGASVDAKLQVEVVALSRKRVSQGQCPVEIMFWENITDWLCRSPDLLRKYNYSNNFLSMSPGDGRFLGNERHGDPASAQVKPSRKPKSKVVLELLATMAYMTWAVAPDLLSEVTGLHDALTHSKSKARETRFWSNGKHASIGTTWYWPNGKHAKIGTTWYWPNGKHARIGKTLHWPDGKYARVGEVWYLPNGVRTNEAGAVSLALKGSGKSDAALKKALAKPRNRLRTTILVVSAWTAAHPGTSEPDLAGVLQS